MQNLVQQNPFTKYKFITKTWKDNLRKGKKDKRKAAGRKEAGGEGEEKRGERRNERKEENTAEHNRGAEAYLPKWH